LQLFPGQPTLKKGGRTHMRFEARICFDNAHDSKTIGVHSFPDTALTLLYATPSKGAATSYRLPNRFRIYVKLFFPHSLNKAIIYSLNILAIE
jgi:hypothetical protein